MLKGLVLVCRKNFHSNKPLMIVMMVCQGCKGCKRISGIRIPNLGLNLGLRALHEKIGKCRYVYIFIHASSPLDQAWRGGIIIYIFLLNYFLIRNIFGKLNTFQNQNRFKINSIISIGFFSL